MRHTLQLDENSVLINVPNAAQFKLRFEDGATLKDLLPEIAEQVAGTGHKLRCVSFYL